MVRALEKAASIPRHCFKELNNLSTTLELGSFKSELLRWGFIDKDKWWRNYLHVHTYYEICYAFSGSGTFKMQDTLYAVKAGDLFVAKPREEHEIISSKKTPLGIYFWSYTLVPSDSKHAVSPSSDAVDRLIHAFIESTSWVNSHVLGMLATLELLTREGVERRPGFSLAVEGLTRKLLLDTARSVVDTRIAGEPDVSQEDHPAKVSINLGMRYMRDNLSRNLSIRDVAAQVSMSERNFNRLFKKYAGKSPLEFLIQARIEAAGQLLLNPALPIKEVAARAGIPDPRYFTTVFRKSIGITPAAYRERGGTTWRDQEHINNKPGRRRKN